MDCRKFETELIEIVLARGTAPSTAPSPAATAHMRVCPPCRDEYLSFEQTFQLLDTWQAPEPTAYFDQRLAVLLREEQAAPPMSWFERLATRLRFNTGRNFRPALAGALSLALIVGGGSVFMIRPAPVPVHPVQASATVMDLQILDRNEQAFQQMDELQQDEDSNSQPTDQDAAPAVPPAS